MTVGSGYEDGWNTPGWTSQWPNLPDATPGAGIETLSPPPAGLKYLYVTGTWRDYNGKPMWGRVFVSPSITSFEIDGEIIMLRGYAQDLDNGTLNIPFLVPVDPSTSNPQSWTYDIRTRVGPTTTNYSLAVPVVGNPDTLNITDLATAVVGSDAPTYYIDGGTP